MSLAFSGSVFQVKYTFIMSSHYYLTHFSLPLFTICNFLASSENHSPHPLLSKVICYNYPLKADKISLRNDQIAPKTSQICHQNLKVLFPATQMLPVLSLAMLTPS